MICWSKLNFLRLIIPLICGILIATFADLSFLPLSVLWALPLLFLFAWGTHVLRVAYARRLIFGVFIFSFVLVWGATGPIWQKPTFAVLHYQHQTESPIFFLLLPYAINPSSSGKTNKIEFYLQGGGERANKLRALRGKLIAYLPSDQKLEIGQSYLVKGSLKDIPPQQYPWMFDYPSYLQSRGFFHLLNVEQFWPTEDLNSSSFRTNIIRWQAFLEVYFHQRLPKQQADLICALLLGKKQGLDAEVKAAFQQVGAMHVLAVSGLHVGIIAYGLQFILNYLPLFGTRKRRVVGAFSILGIAGFVFLSGAGPSVCRAGLMFVMLLIGRQFFRTANIWNILAASAFLMLMVNTGYLFEVGFQLSYIAVASIIFFHPYFYRLIVLKYWFPNYCWQLLCVGFAAQIGTAPLCIYYFHEFSLIFWLSGLLIVPLAGLNLLLGLGLLVLGAVPKIGILLAWGLKNALWLMERIAYLLAKIPGAIVGQLNWTDISLLSCYALIICFSLYLYTSNRKIGRVAILSGFAFLTLMRFQNITPDEQGSMVVYPLRKGMTLEWISGAESFSLGRDSFALSRIQYPQKVLHHGRGVQAEKFQNIGEQNIQFYFGSSTCLWINHPKTKDTYFDTSFDYIFLSTEIPAEQFSLLQYSAKKIIFLAPNLSTDFLQRLENHLGQRKLSPELQFIDKAFLINLINS